jgi:GTPase SAR1 family protein
MEQPSIKNPRLDKFRNDFSEAHLAFAGYASVPVIISIDLLYKLWLNFKMYSNPENGDLEKIPYIVVSDLVLSQLCEPIGYKSFRITDEAREELQQMVSPNTKRQIGFFLKEYISRFFGSLENNVKSIHNLKADLILDPEALQQELKTKILSKDESDYSKAHFVSLFLKESISDGGNSNFITLIAAEEKTEDTIRMPIGSILESKVLPKEDQQNKLVRNRLALEIIRESRRKKKPVLDLGNCGLKDEDFEEGSILIQEISQSTQVTTLILSSEWTDNENKGWLYSSNNGSTNIITSLPKIEIPTLKKLILRGIHLSGMKYEAIAVYKSLQYLDISWNEISDIAPLLKLTQLRFLSIEGNQIINIKPLSSLTKLKQLFINNNSVKNLSPLSAHSKLTKLYFQQNRVSDVTPLAHLVQLNELWGGNNSIKSVEALSALAKIEKISLPHNSISDISPLTGLSKLKILDVSSNVIKTLPPALDSLNIPITWEKEMRGNERKGIFLWENPLENPPVHIIIKGSHAISNYFARKFLSRVEILIYFHRSREKRSTEIVLDALLIFSTEEQQTWLLFTNIRVFFFLDDPETRADNNCLQSNYLLKNVNSVNARAAKDNLSGSIQIADPERWYYSPELFPDTSDLEDTVESKIKKILDLGHYLNASSSIKIPDEIIEQGLEAVEHYLVSSNQKIEYIHLNIGFIGPNNSGKTSLIKRLAGEDFTQFLINAHGTSQTKLSLPEREDVEITLFDFGRELRYGSLGGLFLRSLTTIVLVLDSREDNDLGYWLSFLGAYVPTRPVYLVFNRSDPQKYTNIDEYDLRNQYPSVRGIFRTSSTSQEGLNDLKRSLFTSIESYPRISSLQSWHSVRKKMDASAKDFFSREEYNMICEDAGLTDNNEKVNLAHTLNGQAEYQFILQRSSEKIYLASTVWVFDGINSLLNSPLVAKNNGILNYDQIELIFKRDVDEIRYPETSIPYFLNLLMEHDLCYQESEMVYIFPDHLPIHRSSLVELSGPTLEFSFKYNFLPRDVINGVICSSHSDVLEHMVWRNGIMLRAHNLDATILIAANNASREINVQAGGRQRREYFAEIKKVFKAIQSKFKYLEVSEQLIVNRDGKRIFFDYDLLLHYKQMGRMTIEDPNYMEAYYVEELLRMIETKRLGAFISASFRDNKIVSEIKSMLSQRGIEILDHMNDIPTDQPWESVAVDHILKSKAFIFCISSNSLDSRWLQAELELAMNSQNSGNNVLKIYPIILDNTPFSELPLPIRSMNCTRYNQESILKLCSEISDYINDVDIRPDEASRSDLESLAKEYQQVRSTMKSGDQRTQEMHIIVNKILEKAESFVKFLPELIYSRSPGERLVAIVVLQKIPSLEYLNWLSNRVGDDEKPFIGYQASLTLIRAVEEFIDQNLEQLKSSINRAFANLSVSKFKDPNQVDNIEYCRNILSEKNNSAKRGILQSIKNVFRDVTPLLDDLNKFMGTWRGTYLQYDRKVDFVLELWVESDYGVLGVTNEEGDLGKADITGTINVAEGIIKFEKKYRRTDKANYTVFYTGELSDTMIAKGEWVIPRSVSGRFEMKKK